MGPASKQPNLSGPITIEQIAHRLHGRRSGTGYIAKCPAHDDKVPSLSLRILDGTFLVHCHAGCDQRKVISALESIGLWPRIERTPRRTIVAAYDYRDEAGRVLYQVVRTEPKGFFQRRPDGYGNWINAKSKRQVLYHLPDVLAARCVFVVEGEKDTNTLQENGFVATTNAGGANAPWLPEYTDCLRGREVILIPDNDPPGRKRVLTIARALVGQAASIVVLELKDGRDISDWFARGHSELELIDLVEQKEARN